MTTTEKNILIAEFMGFYTKEGYPLEYYDHQNYYYGLGLFDYHKNWDALMKVVEKIELMNKETRFMGVFTFFGLGRTKIGCYKKEILFCEIDIIGERYGMTPTYEAVIEFIRWYNKNKE